MARYHKAVLLALVAIVVSCDAKAAAFKPRSAVSSSIKRSSDEKLVLASSSSNSNSVQTKITDIQGGAAAGKSSLSTAMFNLVKGIVGAGVLSLPAGEYTD